MQRRKVPSSPVSIFLGREGSARGGGRGSTGSNTPAGFLAEALDPAAESGERDLSPVVGFGLEAAVAIGAGWTAPEEDSPPAAGTAPEQRCRACSSSPPWDPDPGWGEGWRRGMSAESSPPPAEMRLPQPWQWYSPGPSKPQLPEAGDSQGFVGSLRIKIT